MSTKIITRPVLSITRIQVEADQDPLKLFFSEIKSKETKEAYIKTLRISILYGGTREYIRRENKFNLQNLQKRILLKQTNYSKNYTTYLKERKQKPKDNLGLNIQDAVPNKVQWNQKFLNIIEIPL